ncbi:hypothetical protein [Listeria booriae]|uniref:hypothetical protein n=1 Tax=Listeria booriae TaxID=1552123 RepID=UPI00162605BE|nr:hypothetical protein [Listeria booriae]MBC2392214.1 hypothetical protein [Listeria booriae]
MKTNKMVKFDIQHFADGAELETDPVEPKVVTSNEPPVDPPDTEQPTTFNKEDFLKELGVDDENTLQEQLQALKEFQDGQKTEADKQAEALQAAQEQATQALNESAQKDWQIAALKNGVQDAALADVIALAEKTGEKDVNKAVADVLEKYPFFAGEAQKPIISTGNPARKTDPTETTADKFKNAFSQMWPSNNK